jgi:predicted ABC-class ATPase
MNDLANLPDLSRLSRRLTDLDGRGYKAYKGIAGRWRGEGWVLSVEHVQGDPFATPSVIGVELPASWHGLPAELARPASRRTGACDLLLRKFARAAARIPRASGSGRSGEIRVDAGGAEILPRSGCELREPDLELRVRFRLGLPARGRRVLGRAASRLLCEQLPRAVARLRWEALDQQQVWRWARLAEDHARLQETLAERGLLAFLRDGSILPRRSGISAEPLAGAVSFESPEYLRLRLPTAHHGELTGMGLPEGVTLITGGGFHGKTTLLEALQTGVYPHVPGDGREWVVSRPDLVKVRSEDGRAVTGVNLSGFIGDLPGGRDTRAFHTEDASGSTSLAASMVEMMELGARALLLDEDTAATNLLIRDARMQALVGRETITPLIDRVRELHAELGVSTVLVVGGSGDYIDVADHVLLLEDYRVHQATERARQVAARQPTGRRVAPVATPLEVTPRNPLPCSFDARRGRKEKVRAHGLRELTFGDQRLDLDALEQLVDDSQARAIGALLKRLRSRAAPDLSLRPLLEAVVQEVDSAGLWSIEPLPELARPRIFELAAAVNRLRSLDLSRS